MAVSDNEYNLARNLREEARRLADDLEHLIELIQLPASTQDQLWYPTPPDGSI